MPGFDIDHQAKILPRDMTIGIIEEKSLKYLEMHS